MGVMTLVLTVYEGLKPLKDAVAVFTIAAAVYVIFWGLEIFFKAVVVEPVKMHTNQLAKIAQLEDAAKPKLSITEVRCQWKFDTCLCCATIRNMSKTVTAENVSVRIEGRLSEDLGYAPGFNPFHIADLTPSSGHRSINPDSTADFVFPEDLNEMVFILGFQVPQSHEERAQTFALTASSSTSPAVRQEFVVVEDQMSHVRVIKNILFTGSPN